MPFPPNRPYRYVRDEDGNLVDSRAFDPGLTKRCRECGEALDDYCFINGSDAYCPPCLKRRRQEAIERGD